MAQRITMADVAREAGVSLMTVSRALNDKDGISEGTRIRIQEVVARLGYRPSGIARGLVTKRTGTLGLVVPDNSNPYFSEVGRGVEHEAFARGYNVFLCNTEEDLEREAIVLESLTEKQVDGLILCSPRLHDVELSKALRYFPACVLINRVIENHDSSAIRTDDVNGARTAVHHLIQSGHRAIGMLAGPERSFTGRYRQNGYLSALREAGITCEAGWVQYCLPMVDASQNAAVDLLGRFPNLTALFCFNDLVAVGAMKACAQLGLRVPEDVAIIGYDDIPMASLVTPALTTVHIPRYEIGRLAGEMLLAKIEGKPVKDQIVLPVELALRASAP
jgi:LacI family transcriptional regulator